MRGGADFEDIDASPEQPRRVACPIVPLGVYNEHYYFFDPLGQLREMSAAALGRASGQFSLCAGDRTWLTGEWPRRNSDGKIVGHQVDPACAGLMAMCAEAGIWDPEMPVRGRGVWRSPDRREAGDQTPPGAVLCHTGASLCFAGGETVPAGRRLGAAIYPRRPALLPPAAEPALVEEVTALRRDFDLWRFQAIDPGDGDGEPRPDGLASELLFCWVCLALLGAAPRWRVHAMVRARYGAGKSTLIEFLDAQLGAMALVMNNFSEAGFRSSLGNEGRVVLLDEAESDAAGIIAQVLTVIRQMSGGDGVKGARGTGDGNARFFAIAGAAFVAGINLPVLLPQDVSRWLQIEMLTALAQNERAARLAIERAAELSARLRRRALDGWGRFEVALALIRPALIARGCTARQADKLGALLAAGAMMNSDFPIDAAAADDLAESVVPVIDQMREEEADGSDARRCWRLLLSQRADFWRSGEMHSIGSLLRAAREPNAISERNLLDDVCGLRLVTGDKTKSMPEAPCLYVANNHAFLRQVYRDTPWKEGGWAPSLKQLDGARGSHGSVRIAGEKQRAVAIPLALLPLLRSEQLRAERDEAGDDG